MMFGSDDLDNLRAYFSPASLVESMGRFGRIIPFFFALIVFEEECAVVAEAQFREVFERFVGGLC